MSPSPKQKQAEKQQKISKGESRKDEEHTNKLEASNETRLICIAGINLTCL